MLGQQYMPIRRKLTLMIMAGSLLSTILLSLVFMAYEYVTNRQQMTEEISALGSIIADRSNAALIFQDTDLLNENLQSLSLYKSLSLACIYDKKNQKLAMFSRFGDTCPDSAPKGLEQFLDDSYHTVQPVMVDDIEEGRIYLRTDLSDLNAHQKAYTYATLIFILLTIPFILAFSSFLQRFISTPIQLLKQTVSLIGEKNDYSLKAEKESNDEIGDLVDAFNHMVARIAAQNETITAHTDDLEKLVRERTRELENSNRELEAFSYSVSHDLRAPLRAIDGFSMALLEEYGDQLDENAHHYMTRVRKASQKMGLLITSLLQLSRVARKEFNNEAVNLSNVASAICNELHAQHPERNVEFLISPDLSIIGDNQLLHVALENLLENAWKYSKYKDQALIEFGITLVNSQRVYYVRDNGAGFDTQYAGDLFTAFKRLHGHDQFEGTGIGLATVARIIDRHHGKIWAESEINKGSVFYFTLNTPRVSNHKNNTGKAA